MEDNHEKKDHLLRNSDMCSVYGDRDSWRHSLLECHMARTVWALAPPEITEVLMYLQEPTAKAWLSEVRESMSDTESTRVFVTLWALWHAKRKVIHEGLFQPPLSTNLFVERFLGELHLTEKKQTVTSAAKPKPGGWLPPPAGMAKVNVDAATSKSSTFSAIAAVARGETGEFLGASSVVVQGISDPEMVEAMACREGMSLAEDLYLQRFKLATDCANVAKSLEGAGMGPYGHIVREIRARTSAFGEVQFGHEGRTTNVDAHNLARSSLSLDLGRHVWFVYPPEGVCKQQGQQVSDALFSSPGYRNGLGGF